MGPDPNPSPNPNPDPDPNPNPNRLEQAGQDLNSAAVFLLDRGAELEAEVAAGDVGRYKEIQGDARRCSGV